MAVAFDAQATSPTQFNPVTTTQTDTTLTITAAGTLLLVGASYGVHTNGNLPTSSAAQWNGVSMGVPIVSIADTVGLKSLWLFGMVNPPTGNHTVTLTTTGGLFSDCSGGIFSVSFKGTDTSSLANAVPAVNVITNQDQLNQDTLAPNAPFSVTTAAGDMAFAMINMNNTNFPACNIGTFLADLSNFNANAEYGDSAASGGTTQIQFTGTGGNTQHICGIAIRIAQGAAAVVEANPHFSGWRNFKQPDFFRAAQAQLRRNAAADASFLVAQIEANPHFVPKFRPTPASRLLPILRHVAAVDAPAPIIIDNPVNFIGKMQVPPPNRLPLQTQPNDTSFLTTQNDLPVNFVGKMQPAKMTILVSLRHVPATDIPFVAPQIEAPISITARQRTPQAFNNNLALRFVQAVDDTAVAISDANPHFIGHFEPSTFQILDAYRFGGGSDSSVLTPADNPSNFIGKFSNALPKILTALRHNPASDASFLTTQPETNVNMIAKFQPGVFEILPLLRMNQASDASFVGAQTEANPHFTGRFQNATVNLLQLLRINPASDASFLTTQPETNPHFVPRFSVKPFNILMSLRHNAGLDTIVLQVPDTYNSFLAKHVNAAFRLLPLLRMNNSVEVSSATPQIEANPHFLGRYSQAPVNVLALLRQSVPNDLPPVPPNEANPHFLGKFSPTPIRSFLPLRQNAATDIFVAPQPSTGTHFVGKFAPAVVTILRSLRHNQAADQSNQGVQPETNPHFIGKFRAATVNLLRLLRQNPNTEPAAPKKIKLPQANLIGKEGPADLKGIKQDPNLLGD